MTSFSVCCLSGCTCKHCCPYSGQSSNTLYYIIGNAPSTSFLLSCSTLDAHPLNTADHLPILARYSFTSPSVVAKVNSSPALNWALSALDRSCDVYAKLSNESVLPLLDKDYSKKLSGISRLSRQSSYLLLSHLSHTIILSIGPLAVSKIHYCLRCVGEVG